MTDRTDDFRLIAAALPPQPRRGSPHPPKVGELVPMMFLFSHSAVLGCRCIHTYAAQPFISSFYCVCVFCVWSTFSEMVLHK